MKLPTRTSAAIAAAFALTALPATAAMAQEAGCEVVEGTGSAAGDVEDCPDEEVAVLPGRIDRPAGAPADDEEPDTAPAVVSRAPDVQSTELARTGTDADVAIVVAVTALTLGGGALAAARRRSRIDS